MNKNTEDQIRYNVLSCINPVNARAREMIRISLAKIYTPSFFRPSSPCAIHQLGLVPHPVSKLLINCFSALLRLPSSLHFGRVIHQICLPESFSFFNPGKRCIVTGWGHTAWKGNSSNVLREAWVDLISKPDCNYEKYVL